jgi:hypothetical protein
LERLTPAIAGKKPELSPINRVTDKPPMNLSSLSTHLFWDVDVNNLDSDNNKKLIIHRILEYGLLKDWKISLKTYGLQEIAATACTIKNLDIKSASFVSVLSGIPLENFACYNTRQSTVKHWNF